jgi:hypothetical protein
VDFVVFKMLITKHQENLPHIWREIKPYLGRSIYTSVASTRRQDQSNHHRTECIHSYFLSSLVSLPTILALPQPMIGFILLFAFFTAKQAHIIFLFLSFSAHSQHMTSRCKYLHDGRRTTMGPMYVRFGQVEDHRRTSTP